MVLLFLLFSLSLCVYFFFFLLYAFQFTAICTFKACHFIRLILITFHPLHKLFFFSCCCSSYLISKPSSSWIYNLLGIFFFCICRSQLLFLVSAETCSLSIFAIISVISTKDIFYIPSLYTWSIVRAHARNWDNGYRSFA